MAPEPARAFRNLTSSDVSNPRVVAATRNLNDLITIVKLA